MALLPTTSVLTITRLDATWKSLIRGKPRRRPPAAVENRTMLTLADIRQAAGRLEGQVLDTPCVESRTLSQITGCQVFLKFENLQFTASFKERGACNKLT